MKPRLFLIGLVWLFSGCATATQPQNLTSREEFSSRIEVIAQAPMILPGGMGAEQTQIVHATFQQLMADALERRGFAVIAARQTYQISDRLVRDLGGAFDPRKDLQKLSVYRDHLRRELRETFRADALLIAEIIPVAARYSGATARWHGASQRIATDGLRVAEFFSGDNTGTVPAFSLQVWMVDAVSGARLWSGFSGVHVLSKRGADTWVPVPVEQALSDQTRNRNAVEIAFKSLRRVKSEGPLTTREEPPIR